MKNWNVSVGGKRLGQVTETTEALARCAALSKFGLTEDDVGSDPARLGIRPEDDFDVSPA